jgi:drug/metabolite transporter (DMT)-like permease
MMADRSSGWAPWYWYVLVLGVANACAQFFFLSGSDQITNTIVTIVLSVVLMLVVTLVWRLTNKDRVGSRR